jgi:phosphoglycerol geranylgeranyltransferase
LEISRKEMTICLFIDEGSISSKRISIGKIRQSPKHSTRIYGKFKIGLFFYTTNGGVVYALAQAAIAVAFHQKRYFSIVQDSRQIFILLPGQKNSLNPPIFTTKHFAMNHSIYQELRESKRTGQKKLAVLLDPDKLRLKNMEKIVANTIRARIDYFFLGGSLILHDMLEECLSYIKARCDIPVLLFPGNTFQLSERADAILFLSLISGRNPELLIGKHVISAPYLKKSALEIISTGYMLIDGGKSTTAAYISNTLPIPADKEDVALCTAMAGEMLGLKMIYLEAGSGARNPVSETMIRTVREGIDIPLIVGGGIRTPEQAQKSLRAGADMIVIGSAIEKKPELVREMGNVVHEMNKEVKSKT